MKLTTNEIRTAFLNYFKKNQHEMVASSSLIPGNDPTLLFTNAGMVQFKETFLGVEKRPYTRATTSQRCVRAGGKHNDLENVGYTARHHTFFEMLGNFSFGDYFKKEAIRFAWDFLTKELKLPAEKLWVTVYKDDKEAEDIWFNDIGIDQTRFSRCGDKGNFWQMGDTGPCGPCTEIFYDHGADIPGGPPGSPEEDADRYIEIWNLVFMQYDRDASGKLTPLPKPCVDTGMGLERVAAVIQGVHENYDIDLFQSLLKALSALAKDADPNSKSMRVIVDHIRSTAFLICDGVTPSNEGRGYVLRRIIRRAVRHGHKLGLTKTFFYKMVKPLCDAMGEAYPELNQYKTKIENTLKTEEEKFALTLDNGLAILEKQIPSFKNKEIPGDIIFQLYDTYGFPPDLTADIAREYGLSMDMAGFDKCMEKQRKTSQSAKSFKMARPKNLNVEGDTKFVGYDQLTCDANVLTVLQDEHPIKHLEVGEQGIVVLDKTPFYAESGGQVGDIGSLQFDGGSFIVKDTIKQGQVYLHLGILESGSLKAGAKVTAEVDKAFRQAVMLNHSATHLMHAALRDILGEHVTQKGSLVDADKLRFDFSHPKALTRDEIIQIENLVNQQVRLNLQSELDVMTPDEAKQKGAMALFGEKYGDEVRVLKMGDFSTEICGGTHVDATGLIGLFKITNETACASGVRRIEAVTGEGALNYINQHEDRLLTLAKVLKTNPDKLENKLTQLLDENELQKKELSKLKQHQANQKAGDLNNQIKKIGDVSVLATLVQDVDRNALRNMLDDLRVKNKPAAILLATVKDDSVVLVSSVDESCFNAFTAPDLLKFVAVKINGKGGGRKDMAQGGGDNDPKLKKYLDEVPAWIAERM